MTHQDVKCGVDMGAEGEMKQQFLQKICLKDLCKMD